MGENRILKLDEIIHLCKESYLRIPSDIDHRLMCLYFPCRILEFDQNYDNQIENIKRSEDKYERENKKGDV